MKVNKKNSGKAALILNFRTRWSWVVNFTSCPLSLGKEPKYPWGWVGSRTGLNGYGEEKISVAVPGFEPRTIQPLASSGSWRSWS